jgi:hypothetical protein
MDAPARAPPHCLRVLRTPPSSQVLWSRAKRTSRGEKLQERVWVDMARGGGTEEVSEAESSDVGKGMEEAVQRGYASD